MPMLRKLFKSSSDGKKLTKRRPDDATTGSLAEPPQYTETHNGIPSHAPPSFTSRPPSIAPSFATQLPEYDSVVPPGSRGRGLRWHSPYANGGDPNRLSPLPRSPSPEPLTPEQEAALARTKARIERIPGKHWDAIGDLLDPVSAACLKLACRSLYKAMGQYHFAQLNDPANRHHKVEFLYAGVPLALAAAPISPRIGTLPDPDAEDDDVEDGTVDDDLARARTNDNAEPALQQTDALGKPIRNGVYDHRLPFHLFCLNCCRYHKRLKPGQETLAPSYITSPVFICPTAKSLPSPRLALTPSRKLPFTLPQLLARADRLKSPAHGIHMSALSKTWVDIAEGFDGDLNVDPDIVGFNSYDGDDGGPLGWRHRTQLRVHHGHVLLRVSSTHALPQRLLSASETNRLLITRSNYEPYFSTCQHWHTAGPVGPLLSLAKCAIGHAQAPFRTQQDKEGLSADKKGKAKKPPTNGPGSASVSVTGLGSRLTTQCAECRPLRRCEECGTEYLMQLKVVQDRVRRKSSAGVANPTAAPPPLPKFRPYLSVTRYSDLGPCVRPDEDQWRSVAGDDGELPNEVRVRHCRQAPRHLKSVRGAFESDEATGGAQSGAAIPIGRRIEWVREHVEEVERERERERMLQERRAKPQVAPSKS